MPPQKEPEDVDPTRGLLQHEDDFSLALGGPLYQLYLRTHLSTPPLGLLHRRVLSISLFCWLPLLVLSLAGGHLISGVSVPFLLDLEVHTRFLACLPLLIVAELIVHRRIIVVVRQFLERNIIAAEDRPRFAKIIASTNRLRNSAVFEVVLLVFCFTVGHWVWKEHLAFRIATWYDVSSEGAKHLTAAGYWYELVSLPLFRFFLFRWYFRLFIWYQFLWRVRGLPLHLNLFHPDRAGGLGFLTASIFAFSPILLAHTTFLAGHIGDRIWHAGATVLSFKMQILGSIVFLLLLVLIPLSFFLVHLAGARRKAILEFGTLSSHYADGFRQKWILYRSGETGPLLGTPDLQSLADLGNSFKTVCEFNLFPFSKNAIIRLAALLTSPLLPLTLTIVSPKQIVDLLIKLAF